jgi:8-oxo-dGTP pyrophosphatase MutT (NUDIX family)
MTGTFTWHSEIDTRFAVPGDERTALANAMAVEAMALATLDYETTAWRALAEIDERDGFVTRRAVRAVLSRPSDGRFLIFRYPFADGSFRFVIPGGGADPGESPVAALEREVFEETGTAPRDLRHSGLVLFHLLAGSTTGNGRVPTIQYSPVLLGTIDDELPDTGGREAHWFTIDEFEAQPRRPISDPLLSILRSAERGDAIEPIAVWLPA